MNIEPEDGPEIEPCSIQAILDYDLPLKFMDFPTFFPWPTYSALKRIWRQRETNGCGGAFLKYGRKEAVVYPQRLFAILKEMDKLEVEYDDD